MRETHAGFDVVFCDEKLDTHVTYLELLFWSVWHGYVIFCDDKLASQVVCMVCWKI